MVTKSHVETIKGCFREAEYRKWKREGDGIARNKEEMILVMKFLARRLRS